jgi:hypothetical protein
MTGIPIKNLLFSYGKSGYGHSGKSYGGHSSYGSGGYGKNRVPNFELKNSKKNSKFSTHKPYLFVSLTLIYNRVLTIFKLNQPACGFY